MAERNSQGPQGVFFRFIRVLNAAALALAKITAKAPNFVLLFSRTDRLMLLRQI
jgi:hypothetical protein